MMKSIKKLRTLLKKGKYLQNKKFNLKMRGRGPPIKIVFSRNKV